LIYLKVPHRKESPLNFEQPRHNNKMQNPMQYNPNSKNLGNSNFDLIPFNVGDKGLNSS
jgi:hypothetical protein